MSGKIVRLRHAKKARNATSGAKLRQRNVTKGTDGPNRFGPDPLATLAIPATPRAA